MAWVQFLGGELKSYKPHSVAQKNNNNKEKEKYLRNKIKWVSYRPDILWSCFFNLATSTFYWECLYYLHLMHAYSVMSNSVTTRHQSPWNFPGKNTGVDCISYSRGSSNPRIRPESSVSPILQRGSLPLRHLGSLFHLLQPSVWLGFRLPLLLLSRFSRVRLCVTPYTADHQAPPSLGFSKQEHWSGFPFPSPMHESKKWKGSHWVMSNSSRPHGLQPTRLLHPWDFPGKSTGVRCHCLLLTGMQSPLFIDALLSIITFTLQRWRWLMRQRPYDPQI